MAVTCRDAVASFAAATGPLAFGLDFLVDFLEELLLIRDFFVIAIVVSPRIWNLNFFTPLYSACCVPNFILVQTISLSLFKTDS
ncbi:MAG: hypothetical protein WBQ95_09160 [Terracidiphilus sp.]